MFRDALHGYKEAESTAERHQFSLVVGGILVRYLLEHGGSLATVFGEWDAMVAVPSTKNTPPSALAQVITRHFFSLAPQPVELLEPGPGKMEWLQANQEGFRVTTDVSGVRVLLIDDTFTTGARMQSATHALRTAGATVTVGLTVARKIRVSEEYRTVDLWRRQLAVPFSFTQTPWWAVS